MPVWRLLCVHSGEQANANDATARSVSSSAIRISSRVRRAEAEVGAMAEGQVRVGIPLQEERVASRSGADRGRPILPRRRLFPPGRSGHWPSRHAVVAVLRLDGDGVVQRNISSTALSIRSPRGSQEFELVGPLEECEYGAGDRVPGCLGTGGEEQREESREFLVAQRRGSASGNSAWMTVESMSGRRDRCVSL